MDNLEQKDPVSEEDVPSEAGQSQEVETQPVEPSEENVQPEEEQQEEVSAPWEQDERFKGKKPEDIYASYKNLEGKLGELGQKASFADKVEQMGLTPEQVLSVLEQEQSQAEEARMKEDPTGYVKEYIQKQEQARALQNETSQVEALINKNPEYTPFKDKILRLGLLAERDKPYDQIAKEYFGNAIKEGQQSAYKKIEVKKQTQASGVGSIEKSRPSIDDLQNMSSSEMEKILPYAN